jgi:hypothetical protein
MGPAALLAASILGAAVPDCGENRHGSYLITGETVAEARLSEMISGSVAGIGKGAPFCIDAQWHDDRGEIVLQLRDTSCLPGPIWVCWTGAAERDRIPADLSKIVCRMPKQYDTCTLY